MDSRNTDNQQQVGLVEEQADPRAYALAEKLTQEQRENGQLATAVQMGTLTPVEGTSCVNGKHVAGIQHIGERTTEEAKRKKDQHHFQWLLDELDRQIEAIQERIDQLTQDLADAQRRREVAQAKLDKLSEESLFIHDLIEANFNEGWTDENRKRFEKLTGTSTERFSITKLNSMLQTQTLINGRALDVAHAELKSAIDDEISVQGELAHWKSQLAQTRQYKKEAETLSPDQNERAREILRSIRAIASETQGHECQSIEDKQKISDERASLLKTAELTVDEDVLQKLNQPLKLSF